MMRQCRITVLYAPKDKNVIEENLMHLRTAEAGRFSLWTVATSIPGGGNRAVEMKSAVRMAHIVLVFLSVDLMVDQDFNALWDQVNQKPYVLLVSFRPMDLGRFESSGHRELFFDKPMRNQGDQAWVELTRTVRELADSIPEGEAMADNYGGKGNLANLMRGNLEEGNDEDQSRRAAVSIAEYERALQENKDEAVRKLIDASRSRQSHAIVYQLSSSDIAEWIKREVNGHGVVEQFERRYKAGRPLRGLLNDVPWQRMALELVDYLEGEDLSVTVYFENSKGEMTTRQAFLRAGLRG
jgi:hypothetical protein